MVPNLALLCWPEEKLSAAYSSASTTTTCSEAAATSGQQLVDWGASWEAYVRGNVVSTSAAGLIRSFLLKTIAASGAKLDDDDSSDDEAPYEDPDIPKLKLNARSLSSILNPYRKEEEKEGEEDDDGEGGGQHKTAKKFRKKQRKKNFEVEYKKSIDIGRTLWSTEPLRSSDGDRGNPGHMFADDYEDHLQARRATQTNVTSPTNPFDLKRNAAASWDAPTASSTLDSVLKEICAEKEKPNTEQLAFLTHFVRRLKVELLEKQQQCINVTDDEPLLDLIHGFPGT